MSSSMLPRAVRASAALISLVLGLASTTTAAASLSARPSAGSPWAWGNNSFGQLGNGTTIDSAVPVQVMNVEGAVAISGGGQYSLALDSNGRVWAWGRNANGQQGNGTTTDSSVPVQVQGLLQIVAIAAGGAHGLALDSGGVVWAWGWNDFGQLGNGTVTPSSVPVQVSNLSGVVAIAAGTGHSLAVDSNGIAWAWGHNGQGELGDGTTFDRSVPVQVKNLTGVIAVAGANLHSLAVDSNQNAWAWGSNSFGQLGDGTTTNVPVSLPVQVINLTGVADVAGGEAHSIALDSKGNVWAWGWNGDGELGDGTTLSSPTPVPVKYLTKMVAITAGFDHSLALDSHGKVWAWGRNNSGQLGDGTTTNASAPTEVGGLAGVVAISGGTFHSTAIASALCDTRIETRLSHSFISLGQAIRDAARVRNSALCPLAPEGAVTFQVSADAGATWETLGTVKTLDESGHVTSDAYFPPAAGIFYFRAIYGGDFEHKASQSDYAHEKLTARRARTSVKLHVVSQIISLRSAAKATVIIRTDAKGAMPAATGRWAVQASRIWSFSDAPVVLDSGVVSGPLPLPITPQPFTLPSPGLWFLRAIYSGDDNFSASSSEGLEGVVVVLPQEK